MKKIIALASILLMVVSLHAQQMAQPLKIDGKDIYALSLVNEEFTSVESVKLTEQEIASANGIEERMQLFISKATTKGFDAVMTRTGTSATLIKYKNPTSNTFTKLAGNFAKEVYFLSTPVKKYQQVAKVTLVKADFALPFNQLVDKYLSQDAPAVFDALVIENQEAKYIVYE